MIIGTHRVFIPEECGICHENITTMPAQSFLCGHIFHINCCRDENGFRRFNICPFCRLRTQDVMDDTLRERSKKDTMYSCAMVTLMLYSTLALFGLVYAFGSEEIKTLAHGFLSFAPIVFVFTLFCIAEIFPPIADWMVKK